MYKFSEMSKLSKVERNPFLVLTLLKLWCLLRIHIWTLRYPGITAFLAVLLLVAALNHAESFLFIFLGSLVKGLSFPLITAKPQKSGWFKVDLLTLQGLLIGRPATKTTNHWQHHKTAARDFGSTFGDLTEKNLQVKGFSVLLIKKEQ